MSILPHIHRNCTFALGKESAVIQTLNRDFKQMELTRMKGSDMTQSSAIPLLCSSEMAALTGGNPLCAVRVAADLPQGDL